MSLFRIPGEDDQGMRQRLAALLGLPERYLFPLQAKGRHLDALARVYGLERKRWLWIFKERDKKLRARILDQARRPLYVRPLEG